MNEKAFEDSVRKLAINLRDSLGLLDETISSFNFSISICGPISHGEMKIEYKIGENYYSSDVVGNSVAPVLAEFLRRHSWKRKNNPLAIAYVEQNESEEVDNAVV